ncbi:hypothetical protein SBA4_830036 [Candidatus Sulfopaludibacter sp. SbA4]|nr:hypothetical protein SBA4_830036 [Candidatus Sulfopaludibacter sp. SbA4]
MTTRLQVATHSGRPIFLRTKFQPGARNWHGAQRQIGQDADVLAFLVDQLGMKRVS